MPLHGHAGYPRLVITTVLLAVSTSIAVSQTSKADSLLVKAEDLFLVFLQKQIDTNYIANYSDQLAVKLLGVNKYTYFQVNDGINKSKIRYRPVRQVNLGVGVAYKWFALDLAFNVGLIERTNIETEYLDVQARVFTPKQFLEGTLQYYYGQQIENVTGTSAPLQEGSKERNDIRTLNLVLQYLHAFNYGKFSIRAPFVLNEVQKKSAGSTVAGVNFSLYTMAADSSVIPPELDNDFDDRIGITDLLVTSLGFNAGYMYTFVWRKHFFLTISAIPGISFNLGDYSVDFRQPLVSNVSFRLKSMNAVGYNSKKFFIGVQANAGLIRAKVANKLTVDSGHGNAKLFVGYRFGGKK